MQSEETFGRRLRALRKAKGIDQRALARRVEARLSDGGGRGFDVSYLSKIENDRMSPPSRAAILILADELGANTDELLALAGKIPPDFEQTLRDSPGARLFYRSARELGLTDDEWRRLAEELGRRKGQP